MGNPFFSVIVPAHNSEKYISKCLDSIKIQTFTDYELIVVCDACTDNTFREAREYDLYVPEITVIETYYGMDGLARNKGIDLSRGKWLLFLDDDDWWIHEYVLEDIHRVVTMEYGAMLDMVCFDFIWKGKGYAKVEPHRMNIAVWSKAFRREFIGETRFPAIPFTSDQPFMDEICAKKPCAIAMHELMYYYNYLRKGSQSEVHARPDGTAPEA